MTIEDVVNDIDLLHEYIFQYPTKYKEGFTGEELTNLIDNFRLVFPQWNNEKYEWSMMGHTCMLIDGCTIYYHHDVCGGIWNAVAPSQKFGYIKKKV